MPYLGHKEGAFWFYWGLVAVGVVTIITYRKDPVSVGAGIAALFIGGAMLFFPPVRRDGWSLARFATLVGATVSAVSSIVAAWQGIHPRLTVALVSTSASLGIIYALTGREFFGRLFDKAGASPPPALATTDQEIPVLDIPPDDIPDDQVVPALLARLPGEQKQLLISLDLGEKIVSLDEPGLRDLERNRLALRLRQVSGNDYLFRLHPDNADRVHAFYHPAPSPPPRMVLGDAIGLLQVAYAPCSIAMFFVLDHLKSISFPYLDPWPALIRGRRTLIANLLNPVLAHFDKALGGLGAIKALKGECEAEQFSGLMRLLAQTLAEYVAVGHYLLVAVPEFIGKSSLTVERQRLVQWRDQHFVALQELRRIHFHHELEPYITEDVLTNLERFGRMFNPWIFGVEGTDVLSFREDGTYVMVLRFRALYETPIDHLSAVSNAPIVSLRYRKGGPTEDWSTNAVQSERDGKFSLPPLTVCANEVFEVEARGRAPFDFEVKGDVT